jgi:phytoene dehydrogenase-like protein
VYAATTFDVSQYDLAHEIFLFKSWDHSESYDRSLAGDPSCFAITAPTIVDPSLAPESEHLVTTVALAAYDVGRPWHELKDEYTERILREVESVFPGMSAGLTFSEGATPLALHKYSLNRDGAMYGWENSPAQSFARRLANRTPIPGLYLSSAWAQPGSGTVAVMQSGFQTAQIILGHETQDDFLRSLGYPALT